MNKMTNEQIIRRLIMSNWELNYKSVSINFGTDRLAQEVDPEWSIKKITDSLYKNVMTLATYPGEDGEDIV